MHICTEKVSNIKSALFLSNLKLQFSDRCNCTATATFWPDSDMCRHCQYAKTAHNSRFIKDAKSRCKYVLCGRRMLGVIKQVRYDCRSAALGSLLYSNDDEKARHAQDAWMWQLTSTPFQDTAGCTTCLTSLPQSSRAEHAALTALQPSTAPWKALGPF